VSYFGTREISSSHLRLALVVVISFFVAGVISIPVHAAPRSKNSRSLLVTPSTAVLAVGEEHAFSAVDETGRPVTNVKWSVDSSSAEIISEDGPFRIVAKEPGRVTLTAAVDDQTATAVISIAAENDLPGITNRWSLQPMPGFATLVVARTGLQKSTVAPDLYSVEWNSSSNALVRALNYSGQQLWMNRLSAAASPATLKHDLPAFGELFENDVRTSDHSQMIIGDMDRMFVANNPNPPGLPVDGQNILLQAVGDEWGGLLLLERGRFRDSLVDLNPVDGSEAWTYHSKGRLTNELTINYFGDVGIVETLQTPASSSLLIINGKTGEIRHRIEFPYSSSTVDGYACKDPKRNIVQNIRPSRSGSVFTNTDGSMYVQIEIHTESVKFEDCKHTEYSFDDTLKLLRASPDGDAEWTTIKDIHADGDGPFVVQSRVFAGESIPDGSGGVLAAWTFSYVDPKDSKKDFYEARLTRIASSGQHEFSLPMPYWTKGIISLFNQNMVLGDGNILYATNGTSLVRFDTDRGVAEWRRTAPTGEIRIHYSAAGGGILVSNMGVMTLFDAKGNGVGLPWTTVSTETAGFTLSQFDFADHKLTAPLKLRDFEVYAPPTYIAIEDGAPNGDGSLIFVQIVRTNSVTATPTHDPK
jgi:outer membrane protein assembly factor BamB